MIGSFVSCLYYMEEIEEKTGMAGKAEVIMTDHGLLPKANFLFNKFYHIVMHHCKDQYEFFWNKEFSFQQDEQLFDIPTVVVLIARNYTTDHAITVYKDMIFDTSTEKILSRCPQTLGWCCPTGFQKIACAYSLREKQENDRKQNKKQK